MPALRDALWATEARLLERGEPPRRVTPTPRRTAAPGSAGYGPRSRKHQHVIANLQMAFLRLPRHRLEAMAKDVWGAIGRTLVEYALLHRICDPAEARVRVVDMGGLEAVRSSGAGLGVFVSAHLANWNPLPLAATRAGLPLAAVYRRQSNPHIERLMQGWQSTLGCRFLEVRRPRPLPARVAAGVQRGAADRPALRSRRADPFFGTPVYTTVAPARLCRLDLPLILGAVERLEGANFLSPSTAWSCSSRGSARRRRPGR